MAVFDRIMSRLHRVFNKSPERTKVLHIDHDGEATIRVEALRLTGTGGLNCDLSESTLQELVAEINDVAGYSAFLLTTDYADFLSRSLLDESSHLLTDEPSLYCATTLLWSELKVYGWALEEQAERVRQLGKQLYLHSADADWLEYWVRQYFGINRDKDETDAQYRLRGVYEIISLNQNNKSLEVLVENAFANSQCRVTDSVKNPEERIRNGTKFYNGRRAHNNGGHTWFQVHVAFDDDIENLVLVYEARLKALIEKNKAAGTSVEYYTITGRSGFRDGLGVYNGLWRHRNPVYL
jgi:hypothetical protein